MIKGIKKDKNNFDRLTFATLYFDYDRLLGKFSSWLVLESSKKSVRQSPLVKGRVDLDHA